MILGENTIIGGKLIDIKGVNIGEINDDIAVLERFSEDICFGEHRRLVDPALTGVRNVLAASFIGGSTGFCITVSIAACRSRSDEQRYAHCCRDFCD